MKTIILFIITWCLLSKLQAQFCNSESNLCYQKDAYFQDSQVNMQTYKYATVQNIYKSATASIGLSMNVYSPCSLPVNVDSAQASLACNACKRPFILLIHGGGFRWGCRTTTDHECREFAKRGYVVASIDYRLGWVNGDEKSRCGNDFCVPQLNFCAPFKDDSCKITNKDSMNFAAYRALQDASAAMRFVSHYADNLNVDKNYMYVGGQSAGSIIAIICVT